MVVADSRSIDELASWGAHEAILMRPLSARIGPVRVERSDSSDLRMAPFRHFGTILPIFGWHHFGAISPELWMAPFRRWMAPFRRELADIDIALLIRADDKLDRFRTHPSDDSRRALVDALKTAYEKCQEDPNVKAAFDKVLAKARTLGVDIAGKEKP
jgi:hypothetical protein